MADVGKAVAWWGRGERGADIVVVRPRRWDDVDAGIDVVHESVPGALVTDLADLTEADTAGRPLVLRATWSDDDAALERRLAALGFVRGEWITYEVDGASQAEAESRVGDWVDPDIIARALHRSGGRRSLFDALVGDELPPGEVIDAVEAATREPAARSVAEVLSVAEACPWSVVATVAGLTGADVEAGWASLVAAGLTGRRSLVPVVAEHVLAQVGDVRRALLAERIETAILDRDIADAAAADALVALGPATPAGAALLGRCAEQRSGDDVDASADPGRWAMAAMRAGWRSTSVVEVVAQRHLEAGDLDGLLDLADELAGEGDEVAAAGVWFGAVASARFGRWRQALAGAARADELGHGEARRWAPLMSTVRGTAVPPPAAVGTPVDAALAGLHEALEHTISGLDVTPGLGAAAATLVEHRSDGWPIDPVAAAQVIAAVVGSPLPTASTSTAECAASAAHAALLAGRWADARDSLDGACDRGRCGLMAAAVRMGLTRRSGDLGALTAAWNAEGGQCRMIEADLLVVDAVGEMCAAAARLQRWSEVRALSASMQEVTRALAPSSPWRQRADWWRFITAVAAVDRAAAADAATALQQGADGARYAVFADVAAAWCQILDGRLPENADELAASLADAGWAWEASRFAGAAAAVATEVAVSRRLLELARTLRPGGGGRHDSPLTEREHEIGALVAAGSTYKEIGAQLYISPKTVEHHVARIRTKLGASTRAEMLAALRDLD